jgi:hypothetical protein
VLGVAANWASPGEKSARKTFVNFRGVVDSLFEDLDGFGVSSVVQKAD